jgi:hypothetical protein
VEVKMVNVYPDKKTAVAYNTLWEYIDSNAVSRDEALAAFGVLCRRIVELQSKQPNAEGNNREKSNVSNRNSKFFRRC